MRKTGIEIVGMRGGSSENIELNRLRRMSEEELLAHAESTMKPSLWELVKSVEEEFAPYANMALEALELDDRSDGNAGSHLNALLELLISAGEFDSDDLERRMLDAMAESHTSKPTTKKARVAQVAVQQRGVAKNPLLMNAYSELVAAEVAVISKRFCQKRPTKGECQDIYQALPQYWKNASIDGLKVGVEVGKVIQAAYAFSFTPQEQSQEVSSAMEDIRWSLLEKQQQEHSTGRRSLAERRRAGRAEKNVTADTSFIMHDQEGQPRLTIELGFPGRKGARNGSLFSESRLDPIAVFRISDPEDSQRHFSGWFSRVGGKLCPKEHNVISYESFMGKEMHDAIHDAIVAHISGLIESGELINIEDPVEAAPPKPSTAPVRRKRKRGRATQKKSESKKQVDAVEQDPVPVPEPELQVEHAQTLGYDTVLEKEETDKTQPVEVEQIQLPKLLRVGAVVSALKRAAGVTVRQGGKHPVLQRAIGNETLSYTFLNSHSGNKSMVPAGIVAKVLEALQVPEVDFILNVKGRQARALARQLRRAGLAE